MAVSPAVAAPPSAAFTPADGDFYTPPADVGDYANGAIIRYQDSAVADLGVPAKRIMYRSNDVHGDAVGVTGTLFEPTAPWNGPGPRPLVSYAVGTIGQGDQCAPSKLFNQGAEYEAGNVLAILNVGVSVVATDYDGLGTPDRMHTYTNRVVQASAVLDAAIAAKEMGALNLPGVDIAADAKVGIYGYSQGGGAAAAAAELQPTYAPSLDNSLVGTAAGAPPANLAEVAVQIDGSSLSGATGYVINGLIQDYPVVSQPLNELLNQRGQDLLAATRYECVGDTAQHFGFQHSSEFTKSGQPVSSFFANEPFKTIVADQQIGGLTPEAPVYIWQGRNDDLIPYDQSLQLAKDWCVQGANVQFKAYHFPPVFPGSGIGHVLPAVFGSPAAMTWLYQRLIGAPAPDGCAALPKA